MKIDFVASSPDVTIGSYRIWVHDLGKTLQDLNHDVSIVHNIEQLREDSVVILSKADYRWAPHEKLKGRIVGAINIACDHTGLPLDFIIVGSPEEKMSLLKSYENVYIVNLYEKLYEDEPFKDHKEKPIINIGYHGSYIHLSKIGQGFIDAFSRLSKERDLRFINITNEPEMSRKILTKLDMNQEQCIYKKWDFGTIKRDLREIDIGIIPNLIDQTIENPEILRQVSYLFHGMNFTDFVFRFKNKSNAGRAFVFYQMGIPVISDLTPSNMPMLFDEKCGYIAHCQKSWYKALSELLDHETRQKISERANRRFIALYDPYEEASSLVENIEYIMENK